MAKRMLLEDYEIRLIRESRRQRKQLLRAGGVPIGKSGCIKVGRAKKK
jgi:hypothetical protein